MPALFRRIVGGPRSLVMASAVLVTEVGEVMSQW